MLELASGLATAAGGATITVEQAREVASGGRRRFDKGGEQFYDQISALHKAVRGSDPDAALYWYVRMIDGGCDPHYIARRVLRMASEDIGLADPRALTIALECWQAYERLGSPEGELAIAEAVVYMAVAAKSNALYAGYGAAQADVERYGTLAVPMQLRNAPTKLMKELGYGKDYRYAHNEPDAFAAGERYLPEGLPERHYYEPVPRGLEIRIGEALARLRARNQNALAGTAAGDRSEAAMIDPKLLRAAPEEVARNLARRGFTLDVQALNALEEKRRHWQLESDRLRAERNSHARAVGQAKARGGDIAPLMARGEALAREVEDTDRALEAIQAELTDWQLGLPKPAARIRPGGAG